MKGLGAGPVVLSLPKFKMEGSFQLKEILTKMGMKAAFTGAADFSGMDGHPGYLYIGDVIHKSFIAIDEAGTEAAAATAVIMEASAAPLVRPLINTASGKVTGAAFAPDFFTPCP